MKPGTSALFVLDRDRDMEVILHAIRGLGGTVLKTNVDVKRAELIQSTLAASAYRTKNVASCERIFLTSGRIRGASLPAVLGKISHKPDNTASTRATLQPLRRRLRKLESVRANVTSAQLVFARPKFDDTASSWSHSPSCPTNSPSPCFWYRGCVMTLSVRRGTTPGTHEIKAFWFYSWNVEPGRDITSLVVDARGNVLVASTSAS